jgi:hypothetical protein
MSWERIEKESKGRSLEKEEGRLNGRKKSGLVKGLIHQLDRVGAREETLNDWWPDRIQYVLYCKRNGECSVAS